MKCKDFKKFIQTYLDQELHKEVENEWQLHLNQCGVCRTELHIYEKCIRMLQHAMGEEVPPKTLRKKLKQKLGCDCFEFCFPGQAKKLKK